jgi:hypothetical protein
VLRPEQRRERPRVEHDRHRCDPAVAHLEEPVRTDERGHIVGAAMEESHWVDETTPEVRLRGWPGSGQLGLGGQNSGWSFS